MKQHVKREFSVTLFLSSAFLTTILYEKDDKNHSKRHIFLKKTENVLMNADRNGATVKELSPLISFWIKGFTILIFDEKTYYKPFASLCFNDSFFHFY